jgi:2-dehydro-3-deoxyphosphogluconate aldolase/(4S)-4-hydroxy-2-oxoglutarate aldolase
LREWFDRGETIKVSTIQNTLNKLKEAYIVPVIRADKYEDANEAIQELKEVGYKPIEITLTTPDAIRLIRNWTNDDFLLVGAGTVTSLNEAQECIEAGVNYIVSPCYVEGLGDLCAQKDVVCIMSGLTPSEVMQSWQGGSNVVKVFPASSIGGAAHIKSLKTVFPDILLLPTGGINLDNIVSYLEAGADFIGTGADLVDIKLLNSGRISEFREKAILYKQTVENYISEVYQK